MSAASRAGLRLLRRALSAGADGAGRVRLGRAALLLARFERVVPVRGRPRAAISCPSAGCPLSSSDWIGPLAFRLRPSLDGTRETFLPHDAGVALREADVRRDVVPAVRRHGALVGAQLLDQRQLRSIPPERSRARQRLRHVRRVLLTGHDRGRGAPRPPTYLPRLADRPTLAVEHDRRPTGCVAAPVAIPWVRVLEHLDPRNARERRHEHAGAHDPALVLHRRLRGGSGNRGAAPAPSVEEAPPGAWRILRRLRVRRPRQRRAMPGVRERGSSPSGPFSRYAGRRLG